MPVNALIFTQVMQTQYAYSRALGAYRVATEIRKAGYTCQVIDLFTKFSDEEMDKILHSFIGTETLMVGFSATFYEYVDERLDTMQQEISGKTTQVPNAHTFTLNYPYHQERMKIWFSKMRAINPNIKIVLGGSKAGNLTGDCDAYAVGYCDQATVEYMKYLDKKNPFFQFETINDKQIAFYGDKYTSKFEFTTSTVDWHESDYIMHNETLPIELARGCIFSCKFCSYPLNGKKKLDFIKTDNVLRDEFLRNYNEFGITRYVYCDDTHNDSVEKLERLHKVATSLPFEIEYAAYLRHDLIYAHKETAVLLRESGLRSAIFGIETLNHESGKAIGKGMHPEKLKEMLYWLREDVWKNDVAMGSGFIVGLPHDTPETINEWSKWLLDKSCPIDSFHFEPLYITNTKIHNKLWKSEFEKSSDKYGYKLGKNGFWENEHYTFHTAATHAKQLLKIAFDNDRFRCAGFPIIMFANLGLVPKDLIGVSRTSIFRQVEQLNKAYIDQYKVRLLNNL